MTVTTSLCTSSHTMQSTQGTSWRSGDRPPCLGPVNTHSTPVPSMNGRLWVGHSPTTSTTQDVSCQQFRQTWQRSAGDKSLVCRTVVLWPQSVTYGKTIPGDSVTNSQTERRRSSSATRRPERLVSILEPLHEKLVDEEVNEKTTSSENNV